MRFWVFVVVGCLSCAGAAPKSKSPAPAAVIGEDSAAQRRPYAEVVTARAAEAPSSPGLWVSALAPAQLLSKLPDSVQSAPLLSALSNLSLLASEVYGADVSSVIDLTQPLDVAMSMADSAAEPSAAFSFRVRSPDAIEQGRAGLTLKRLAAGTWLIGGELPLAEPPIDEEAEESEEAEGAEDEDGAAGEQVAARWPCLLARAPAPVGYRVLCSRTLATTRELAPFLLSGLAAPTSDVHVELTGPVYRAGIERGIAELRAETDAEPHGSGSEKLGTDVALAVLEVLAAHDRVTLDLSLGKSGVELVLDVGFASSPGTAAFATWLRFASKQKLPPSFALLPGDASVAFAFSGLGKSETRSFLDRMLHELFNDLDREFIISAKDQHEMREAFAGVVPEEARISVAMGEDGAAVERALHSDGVRGADQAHSTLSPGAVKDLQAALGGWTVVAVDVAASRYMPAIERMERADRLPLRRRPGVPRRDSEREDTRIRRRPLVTRGLPVGTLHLVEEVRPAKTYRPPLDGSEPPVLPFDRHHVIVPDGQRVWISVARSEALAGERALAALRGSARLGQRTDVKAAIERPLLAALSVTLAGLTLQNLDWDSARQREMARLQFQVFGDGLRTVQAPMLLTLSGISSQGGSGFALRAEAQLTPAALSDLLKWRSPAFMQP